MTLTLHRSRSTPQGSLQCTPGMLLRPDGSRFAFTMELPWTTT